MPRFHLDTGCSANEGITNSICGVDLPDCDQFHLCRDPRKPFERFRQRDGAAFPRFKQLAAGHPDAPAIQVAIFRRPFHWLIFRIGLVLFLAKDAGIGPAQDAQPRHKAERHSWRRVRPCRVQHRPRSQGLLHTCNFADVTINSFIVAGLIPSRTDGIAQQLSHGDLQISFEREVIHGSATFDVITDGQEDFAHM